jgi:hypothetical protein
MKIWHVILLVLAIFIGSISMGVYYDNTHWLWLTLGSLCGLGYLRYWDEKRTWNNGICLKYNEPWEYVEIVTYTETWDYMFECQDITILISPSDFIVNEYKGTKKLGT